MKTNTPESESERRREFGGLGEVVSTLLRDHALTGLSCSSYRFSFSGGFVLSTTFVCTALELELQLRMLLPWTNRQIKSLRTG